MIVLYALDLPLCESKSILRHESPLVTQCMCLTTLTGWGNELDPTIARRRAVWGIAGIVVVAYAFFEISRRLEVCLLQSLLLRPPLLDLPLDYIHYVAAALCNNSLLSSV